MADYRSKLIRGFCTAVLYPWMHLRYTVAAQGEPHAQSIVIANHVNKYDGLFPMVQFPQITYALGKKELFTTPVMRRFLTATGIIPVNSKPHLNPGEEYVNDVSKLLPEHKRLAFCLDIHSTMKTMKPDWEAMSKHQLITGNTLLCYGEGTRMPTYSIPEIKHGAARMAIDLWFTHRIKIGIQPMFQGYPKHGILYVPERDSLPDTGSTIHMHIGKRITIDDVITLHGPLDLMASELAQRYRQEIIRCKEEIKEHYHLLEDIAHKSTSP